MRPYPNALPTRRTRVPGIDTRLRTDANELIVARPADTFPGNDPRERVMTRPGELPRPAWLAARVAPLPALGSEQAGPLFASLIAPQRRHRIRAPRPPRREP